MTIEMPVNELPEAQINGMMDRLQNVIQDTEVAPFSDSSLVEALDRVAAIHPFTKGTSPSCHTALMVTYPM